MEAEDHYYQTILSNYDTNGKHKHNIKPTNQSSCDDTVINNTNFITIGKDLYTIKEEIKEEYKIEILVDINSSSNAKYTYNEVKRAFICEKIIEFPFKSVFNFGSVPNTLSCINKYLLKALIIVDHSLIPGSYINCKIIGCCEIQNKKHKIINEYIIMSPSDEIADYMDDCNDMDDLNKEFINKITYMLLYKYNVDFNEQNIIVNFKNKMDGINLYETYKLKH